jgi:hypothetical protein
MPNNEKKKITTTIRVDKSIYERFKKKIYDEVGYKDGVIGDAITQLMASYLCSV